MAAKRNASGLSALPRPSLDNEELVRRNDDNPIIDVDEDQRKFDQICNSLVSDYLGKILGQQFLADRSRISKWWSIALPPLLDWEAGCAGG